MFSKILGLQGKGTVLVVLKYQGYIINKREKKTKLFHIMKSSTSHVTGLKAGQIWTSWKCGWFMLSGGTSALL